MLEAAELLLGSPPRAGMLHTCPFLPGWLLQAAGGEESPEAAGIRPGCASLPWDQGPQWLEAVPLPRKEAVADQSGGGEY